MRAYLVIIPSVAMIAVILALTEFDVAPLWATVAGVFVWGSLLVLLWPRRG